MIRRQATVGWALVAIGFAAIGAGWAGVQSTPVVAVQLSYLVSGGMLGLALVIVGIGVQRNDELRIIREGVAELRDRLDEVDLDLRDEMQFAKLLDEGQNAPKARGPASR